MKRNFALLLVFVVLIPFFMYLINNKPVNKLSLSISEDYSALIITSENTTKTNDKKTVFHYYSASGKLVGEDWVAYGGQKDVFLAGYSMFLVNSWNELVEVDIFDRTIYRYPSGNSNGKEIQFLTGENSQNLVFTYYKTESEPNTFDTSICIVDMEEPNIVFCREMEIEVFDIVAFEQKIYAITKDNANDSYLIVFDMELGIIDEIIIEASYYAFEKGSYNSELYMVSPYGYYDVIENKSYTLSENAATHTLFYNHNVVQVVDDVKTNTSKVIVYSGIADHKTEKDFIMFEDVYSYTCGYLFVSYIEDGKRVFTHIDVRTMKETGPRIVTEFAENVTVIEYAAVIPCEL